MFVAGVTSIVSEKVILSTPVTVLSSDESKVGDVTAGSALSTVTSTVRWFAVPKLPVDVTLTW